MPTKVKLLPCPFCGSERLDDSCQDYDDQGAFFFVFCQQCETEGPTSRNHNAALSAWNTREGRPMATDQRILVDFALADLSLWIERGLKNLKSRTVYHGGAATNSYAVAEFPDWDLRQKLDLIESAKNDAIRVLDLNHRLVECLKEAMAQTGCDGDLCLYRWHETARQILRDVEDAIATNPKKENTNGNN